MTRSRPRLRSTPEAEENLRGHAVALAEETEQDVLGADVGVAELQRLAQRELEHLLGPRRERDVPGSRGLLPAADNLLDPMPDRLEADPQGRQRPGGDTFALPQEAEQDVLGADVVVIQVPGLGLRQHDDPARPVGETLEHGSAPLPVCTQYNVRRAARVALSCGWRRRG